MKSQLASCLVIYSCGIASQQSTELCLQYLLQHVSSLQMSCWQGLAEQNGFAWPCSNSRISAAAMLKVSRGASSSAALGSCLDLPQRLAFGINAKGVSRFLILGSKSQRQRGFGLRHSRHSFCELLGPMLALSSRMRHFRPSHLASRSCGATTEAFKASKASKAFCEIDVWSFNLRTEKVKEEDSLNAWPQRCGGVAALIAKYHPAIVCVQEATVAMLRDICLHLDGKYEWKATSRFPNEQDESAGFLVDTSRVRLLDYSVFWLSPQGCPDGTASWDARFPRTCEALLLSIVGIEGSQMRILNTHFDHQGSVARLQSAQMIAESITRFSDRMPACAQILCGDFNSPKSSEPYSILTENRQPAATTARPLKDAFRCDGEVDSGGVQSTIHKWQGVRFAEERGDGTVELSDGTRYDRYDSRHIDWILFQDGLPGKADFTRLQALRCKVITDSMASGRYPSDHFPVSATFRVEVCASPTPSVERSRL